jgi:non-heme chloroperoxidase
MNVLDHELGMVTPDEAVDFVKNVRRDHEKFTQDFVNMMLSIEQSREDKEELVSETLKMPADCAATLAFDHFHNDWRDIMKRIHVPTLVIGATKSHVKWQSQAWIHEQIPGSEILVFEDRAHLMFYEEPEKFNSAVESFISKS